jgi:hypothetical protein
MLNNNFVKSSFIDGLLYKPSDIKVLVESEMDETIRFLKIKRIVESLHITTLNDLNETLDNLNLYTVKIENSVIVESKKQSLLKEIFGLLVGLLKALAPLIIKLIGWLVGLFVKTETFGKSANFISKITPDSIKSSIEFAYKNYKDAKTGLGKIADTVTKKLNDIFKGSPEKPPVVNVDNISQAHGALVDKIEKWPLIGKIISTGKKFGIKPQGFYTFLAMTTLSVLAIFGAPGVATILTIYGGVKLGARVLKATGEVSSKVADQAKQSMAKAKGETPPPEGGSGDESIDDMLKSFDSPNTGKDAAQAAKPPENIPPELEGVVGKWAEMLNGYIDKGEKDAALEKMKTALGQLIKNGDLQKEQVSPLVKSIVSKIETTEDIKAGITSALIDTVVGMSA